MRRGAGTAIVTCPVMGSLGSATRAAAAMSWVSGSQTVRQAGAEGQLCVIAKTLEIVTISVNNQRACSSEAAARCSVCACAMASLTCDSCAAMPCCVYATTWSCCTQKPRF